MIPKEFFKHIHQLEITTKRLVTDLFAGEYESIFKGRGIEFSEVREYQVGDDIRSIDRNVTARMNRAYTKRYVEERELTIMFLVDLSNSSAFGSTDRTKREFAAEISALLAYSAFHNQDKIGLLLFSDRVEKYLAPKKGRLHLLEIIRDLLYFNPQGKGTDINLALKFLNRVIPHRCIVFIISDFIAKDFWKLLRITFKRHDTICIVVQDRCESVLPQAGLVEFEDAETGEIQVFNTFHGALVKDFEKRARVRTTELFEKFFAIGLDAIPITVGEPYVQPLMKFFRMRQRRQGLHAA
ncbi:MAG: DUF58 domain-containing protein [Candidatus Omnitrophota bacterium]